ncbi:unnamed protein product [Pleuronectes platessa]|uniref:Programmed cell death protein 5 n=1 Tax=Pleuronectes platessa TaxID=8262 RepID=A0A9N7Z5U4_PLEPL|nr:unnamed protein product [Pleuronectes platessa]
MNKTKIRKIFFLRLVNYSVFDCSLCLSHGSVSSKSTPLPAAGGCRNYRQNTGMLQIISKERRPNKERGEMRNSILAQVLDQSARARLSNLALVKPEKAKAVENYLIQMARYGKLGGKISESGLIEILEKVSQQTEKKTTVKFNRQRVMDSDDDDDF